MSEAANPFTEHGSDDAGGARSLVGFAEELVASLHLDTDPTYPDDPSVSDATEPPQAFTPPPFRGELPPPPGFPTPAPPPGEFFEETPVAAVADTTAAQHSRIRRLFSRRSARRSDTPGDASVSVVTERATSCGGTPTDLEPTSVQLADAAAAVAPAPADTGEPLSGPAVIAGGAGEHDQRLAQEELERRAAAEQAEIEREAAVLASILAEEQARLASEDKVRDDMIAEARRVEEQRRKDDTRAAKEAAKAQRKAKRAALAAAKRGSAQHDDTVMVIEIGETPGPTRRRGPVASGRARRRQGREQQAMAQRAQQLGTFDVTEPAPAHPSTTPGPVGAGINFASFGLPEDLPPI